MRLLTIDIETRPIEARTWGLWGQNIGINQITNPGGLLCFAAKFHGERAVHFHSAWEDGERDMARELHRLFDEADAVAGWNSDKFDVRWIQAQFLKHGMAKPSPFAKVDLMKSVKRQVYLPSYKLDFVAGWLGLGRKERTGGFDLWSDVLAGCPKAQAHMKKYNVRDDQDASVCQIPMQGLRDVASVGSQRAGRREAEGGRMTWKQATLRGMEWGSILGAVVCLMAKDGASATANVALAAYCRWARSA